jgi:hypothetical protein
VVLLCVEHEAAKAAADVHHPVGAGVHHQRVVEPQAVEVRAQSIVVARIDACLGDGAVGLGQLVPLVANPHRQGRGAVELALHAQPEGEREVAIHVERLVEVGFDHADVPESEDAPLRAGGAEVEPHLRLARKVLPGRAVGKRDVQAHRRPASDPLDHAFEQPGHRSPLLPEHPC